MEDQKRRSKGDKDGAVKMVLEAAQTDALEQKGVNATVDIGKYEWDAAGSGETATSQLKAIFCQKAFIEEYAYDESSEADVGIVLDSTPFYAEAGGQIYDTGVISV